MSENTPGPWDLDNQTHAEVLGDDYHVIDSGNGYFDKDTCSGFRVATYMSQSDARLMTAAPEMYAALKFMVEQMQLPENSEYTLGAYLHGFGFDMAKRALDKATK